MSIPQLLNSSDRLTDAIFFGSRLGSGSAVPSTRQIISGFGLKGGGDLTANRTLAVNDLVNGYNVMNHGAVADGVTDNTAVYTAIFGLATRGTLVFPPGAYAGSLLLPDTGDTRQNNWSVVGAGITQTFLTPAATNTKLISKANRAGNIIQGPVLGGFTVKAHASGSTGPAIDLAGFRFCEFGHIGYSSNAGGDFNSLFHLSAGQMRCYGNLLHHVVIDGGTVPNTGPATVVLFDAKNDAGTPQGLSFTANNNVLEAFKVFANTGITTGIDALRSDRTTVKDCFWEMNPGCTYLIYGSGTLTSGNSYESGVTTDTIKFMTVGGEGSSSNCTSIKDSFSDMTALTFPSTVSDNRILDPDLAVSCTFTDLGGTNSNNIVMLGAKVLSGTAVTLHAGSRGTAPSVSSTNLGAGGTVTLLSGSNDTDGIISLNFGTTVPDSRGVATVTFATPYQNVPCVMACPAAGPPSPGTVWSSPAAAAPAFQVGDIATTQFTVRWSQNAAAGDNAVLRINYHVKGLPN